MNENIANALRSMIESFIAGRSFAPDLRQLTKEELKEFASEFAKLRKQFTTDCVIAIFPSISDLLAGWRPSEHSVEGYIVTGSASGGPGESLSPLWDEERRRIERFKNPLEDRGEPHLIPLQEKIDRKKFLNQISSSREEKIFPKKFTHKSPITGREHDNSSLGCSLCLTEQGDAQSEFDKKWEGKLPY